MSRFIACLACSLGTGLPALSVSSAAADPTMLSLADPPYYQEFRSNPPVAGNFLVGLRWQDAAPDGERKFNPEGVSLRVPDSLRGHTACVAINSQDGRYAAENLYRVPLDVIRQPVLEGPGGAAGKRVGKGDGQEPLRRYEVGQMAVIIRAVDECDAAEIGPIVPALMKVDSQLEGTDRATGAALIASVNADPDTITLLLSGRDGKAVSKAEHCKNPSMSLVWIAFRADCAIPVPASLRPDVYNLTLTVQERFKPYSVPFVVLLGPGPSSSAAR